MPIFHRHQLFKIYQILQNILFPKSNFVLRLVKQILKNLINYNPNVYIITSYEELGGISWQCKITLYW